VHACVRQAARPERHAAAAPAAVAVHSVFTKPTSRAPLPTPAAADSEAGGKAATQPRLAPPPLPLLPPAARGTGSSLPSVLDTGAGDGGTHSQLCRNGLRCSSRKRARAVHSSCLLSPEHDNPYEFPSSSSDDQAGPAGRATSMQQPASRIPVPLSPRQPRRQQAPNTKHALGTWHSGSRGIQDGNAVEVICGELKVRIVDPGP